MLIILLFLNGISDVFTILNLENKFLNVIGVFVKEITMPTWQLVISFSY